MNAALLCTALVLLGWAGLGFGQARTHQATFGLEGSERRRRAFAAAGCALLAIAFIVAVMASGWEFGPVLWAALLSLGAMAWVLAIALDARRAPWLLLPAVLLGATALLS